MIYTYERTKTVDKKPITETLEIEIYSGLTFSGEALEEEKELRRFLGLPLTKKLVYKKRAKYPNWETFNVEKVVIEELYSDWFTLNVDGVKIHSAFFSHMQKSNFEKDMRTMEKENGFSLAGL